MRFVALSLAVCAALGCKDSQPKQSTKDDTEATKRGQAARPSLGKQKSGARPLAQVKKVSATITYTSRELKLDATQLGHRLQDGIIPPETRDQLLTALEVAGASSDPIGISIEPTLPNLRVFELLHAMRAAGFRNVALLAGQGFIAVPLELVESDQLGEGVHPVVTVTGGRIILWSHSGEEGTSQKPKLAFGIGGSMAPLTDALVEIVERRWPDGAREDEDRVITVQMSAREKAEMLLQVIAAVRGTGSMELFPTIYLAAGN